MTTRIVLTVVLAALAAGTTACGPSPTEVSSERATDQVRALAANLRDSIGHAVADGQDETQVVLPLEQHQELGRKRTQDGFEIDVVLYDHAEAGGGGTYVKTIVRLCVRYVVHQRPSPKVDLSDLDCPSSLPNTVEGYGEIDRTVRLND
ncbi:hypothetical protein SK571_08175 [Lentzea sp. BCCO 10_0798]|uniref:Lipoprotein n=1 Tax=Lentzea kristufekii TaxID=3095430 RepID=A0ABU4TM78_9PSEU|nr:hypothetical protein [Lentzea sp. BCCO 10_0798]MDX8049354.1 hypothetical protein [Lentzea sp. BCCO 10_0798]